MRSGFVGIRRQSGRSRRLQRMLAVVLAVTAVACGGSLGRVPRATATAETEGFKMLRPQLQARRCEGAFVGSDGNRDLVGECIRELLASDHEADAVMNAEVEWRSFSIGVYRWQCAILRGDVVRSVRTVMLPMPGGHGAHHGH